MWFLTTKTYSQTEITRQFDSLSRLTSVQVFGCTQIAYQYDQTGNRLLHEIKGGISLTAKVFLQGPYDQGTGLMRDNIREEALIPIDEPYASLGLTHLRDGGGEKSSFSVFSNTGDDAIVDWVFVELRDENDNENTITTRSALLQRDGNIVDYDGVSPVRFINTCPGNFFVVIRHRNHLGVMTNDPIPLAEEGGQIVDFTDPGVETWGNSAQRSLGSVKVMWGGDGNQDGLVIYQGAGSDLLPITQRVFTDPLNTQFEFSFPSVGYSLSDYTMDAATRYQGANSDILPITQSVFSNPLNINFEFSFPVIEQLPENY